MNRRVAQSLILSTIRVVVRNDQFILVGLSIVIGCLSALGAIAFREMIDAVQWVAFGYGGVGLASHAAGLPWWYLIAIPVLGGLVVGVLLKTTMPGGRPQGVPHVMEACALRGGYMPLRPGLAAAVVSATSLGVGSSTGREGPVVHLGATLAAAMARGLGMSASLARTLLGSGVAAAVAASFNAPIAGVFFALEVVVGHYALSAFAPIVMASVTGTIVSRLYYGDFPAFVLPHTYQIASFWEFPAFALLGVTCAAVALAFMYAAIYAERWVGRLDLPVIVQPALGGLVLGLIALAFPEVLGVGYEATDAALREALPLWLLMALIVVKTVATAVCIGCRFGGGVFSPSLFLGAMTGGAFGYIATLAFPHLSSGHGAYTLIGMGAVAAAVLGAPMSTILIVFEMTNDYELTVALMVAVVIATVITQQVLGQSLFTWQLEARGVKLKGGRETNLLSQIRVSAVMKHDHTTIRPDATVPEVMDALNGAHYGEVFVVEPGDQGLIGILTIVDLAHIKPDDGRSAAEIARRNPPLLEATDDIRAAMQLMDREAESHIPVVESRDTRRIVGFVHEHDVLLAYHRALLQARAEERGEGPETGNQPP